MSEITTRPCKNKRGQLSVPRENGVDKQPHRIKCLGAFLQAGRRGQEKMVWPPARARRGSENLNQAGFGGFTICFTVSDLRIHARGAGKQVRSRGKPAWWGREHRGGACLHGRKGKEGWRKSVPPYPQYGSRMEYKTVGSSPPSVGVLAGIRERGGVEQPGEKRSQGRQNSLDPGLKFAPVDRKRSLVEHAEARTRTPDRTVGEVACDREPQRRA